MAKGKPRKPKANTNPKPATRSNQPTLAAFLPQALTTDPQGTNPSMSAPTAQRNTQVNTQLVVQGPTEMEMATPPRNDSDTQKIARTPRQDEGRNPKLRRTDDPMESELSNEITPPPKIANTTAAKLDQANKAAYVFTWAGYPAFAGKAPDMIQDFFKEKAAPFVANICEETPEDSIHDNLKKHFAPIADAMFEKHSKATEDQLEEAVRWCNAPHQTHKEMTKDKPRLIEKAEECQELFHRLRVTPPEAFEGFWNKETGALLQVFETTVWKIANDLYGSDWTLQEVPAQKKARDRVQFEKDYSATSSGLFRTEDSKPPATKTVSKPNPYSKKKKKDAKLTRTHQTFFRVSLPLLTEREHQDLNAKVHSQFVTMLTYIRQVDSRAVILPFPPEVKQYAGEVMEVADQILEGSYEPSEEIDPYARELIKALKTPDAILEKGEVRLTVTLDEHITGWKRQKENVASEPHGLSFAHYKCAAFDRALAMVDMLMRNTPIEIGFVPQLWRQITDVEILKKLGVYNVDKMRLIQLMAADFQSNNKLLGKRLLAHAEEANTIDPDQHGSRKKHRANLAGLNKVLLSNHINRKKMAGAFCMNDAKSCYDRVNHSIAILSMRRQGCPKVVCETLYKTLQLASHHIQTGYGITKNAYNDPPIDPPLQGNCQGNGNGPTAWALISTVLIEAMRAAGHGSKLSSAITAVALWIICFAFVDDTDTVMTGEDENETGEQLLPKFQTMVDRWEGLLRASGGAIEPGKSFWYLIDSLWDPTDERFYSRNIADMQGTLSILNCKGERVTLQRKELQNAEKTLGIYIAMNSDQTDEIEYLTRESERFAQQLATSSHTRDEATYTFNFSFMKTIEYPLVATMISKDQWDSILKPALRASLRAGGMAANFPATAFFGPILYQNRNQLAIFERCKRI